MKNRIPFKIKVVLLIIALTGLLAAVFLPSAKAQTNAPTNPFTNAPAQLNPVLAMFESMPTKPLNQASWFLDTGAYNGPTLNPQTGAVGIALQNYIDFDLLLSTNTPIAIGGEVRNVLTHIDYVGANLAYLKPLSATMLLGPQLRAGEDLDNRVPQVTAELHGRWQPLGPGTPYTDVAVGYTEEFGISRSAPKSGGSVCGHLGITIPF